MSQQPGEEIHMVRCQAKALRPVEWGSGNMPWGSAQIPQRGSSPKKMAMVSWGFYGTSIT